MMARSDMEQPHKGRWWKYTEVERVRVSLRDLGIIEANRERLVARRGGIKAEGWS
jgi:hypothetical protein